jgi:hypothetical protein
MGMSGIARNPIFSIYRGDYGRQAFLSGHSAGTTIFGSFK